MKTTIITIGSILGVVLLLNISGCNYRRVETIKAAAPEVWRRSGFEIVAYEGYQIGTPECPGGKVWYTLQRTGDPSIRYTACLSKWGDEYHIYQLRAIDAITP